MLTTTDTALAGRAAQGDPEAFEAVYERSLACVFRFAVRRTGSRAAAEALTERILERVFRELATWRGDVPYAAWLLRVAKRVAATEPPAPLRPSRVGPARPAPRVAPRSL